jgi:hypothetical protein
MTTSTIRFLAMFSLITLLGPLGVMAQGPVRFKIPFGFTAGAKSFAAGDYEVDEVTNKVLRIRSNDGRANVVVLTHGEEPGKNRGKAVLSFHRYGDQYFLFKMANDNRGWGLAPSIHEKELIAEAASPKQLDVIASSRK